MSEATVNILLVDDDDVDIMTLQRAFKRNNISNPLFIGNNGIEALDLLRGTNGAEKINPAPRIILLDINMPIMDGFQFLEEFEKITGKLHDKCKIIMLSSSISPRDIDRAASNKFVKKYLNKPLNSRYLQAITLWSFTDYTEKNKGS